MMSRDEYARIWWEIAAFYVIKGGDKKLVGFFHIAFLVVFLVVSMN